LEGESNHGRSTGGNIGSVGDGYLDGDDSDSVDTSRGVSDRDYNRQRFSDGGFNCDADWMGRLLGGSDNGHVELQRHEHFHDTLYESVVGNSGRHVLTFLHGVSVRVLRSDSVRLHSLEPDVSSCGGNGHARVQISLWGLMKTLSDNQFLLFWGWATVGFLAVVVFGEWFLRK
jgi:hypothetical protein